MNFLEVAVGKLVFFLGLLVFLIINAQVPFGVFVNAVRADEVILLLRGRLMLAPRVPFIPYKFSLVHQFFGICESYFVQFHHDDSPPSKFAALTFSAKGQDWSGADGGPYGVYLAAGHIFGSRYLRGRSEKATLGKERSLPAESNREGSDSKSHRA